MQERKKSGGDGKNNSSSSRNCGQIGMEEERMDIVFVCQEEGCFKKGILAENAIKDSFNSHILFLFLKTIKTSEGGREVGRKGHCLDVSIPIDSTSEEIFLLKSGGEAEQK